MAVLGRAAGECPPSHAIRIDPHEAGEPFDRRARRVQHPLRAVQEVLGGVEGRVAHERLRVDDEPRFAPGREHVARMEIRRQQDVARNGIVAQRSERPQPLADEPGIEPPSLVRQRLLDPEVDHLGERAERMR